jgi:hypothetical protein
MSDATDMTGIMPTNSGLQSISAFWLISAPSATAAELTAGHQCQQHAQDYRDFNRLRGLMPWLIWNWFIFTWLQLWYFWLAPQNTCLIQVALSRLYNQNAPNFIGKCTSTYSFTKTVSMFFYQSRNVSSTPPKSSPVIWSLFDALIFNIIFFDSLLIHFSWKLSPTYLAFYSLDHAMTCLAYHNWFPFSPFHGQFPYYIDWVFFPDILTGHLQHSFQVIFYSFRWF